MKILKFLFYFIILLLIFAILPDDFLKNIKKIFNWEVFFNTLKTGWYRFLDFIKNTIGIDFNQFFINLKKFLGIDLIYLWTIIKNFLANLFQKLANFFK
jgi:hypothetical protein